MKSIFVDTSALNALGNRRDRFHKQAADLFRELEQTHCHLYTTSAVLMELGNAFSAAPFKPLAIKPITWIDNSKNRTVIVVDRAVLGDGVERFTRRLDKDRGLLDCTSMQVAEGHSIADVVTNDHHFRQGGFNILIGPLL